MKPSQLRFWIHRYGNTGLLLVGGYLCLRWLWAKPRREFVAALMVGIVGTCFYFCLCSHGGKETPLPPAKLPVMFPQRKTAPSLVNPATTALTHLLEKIYRESSITHETPAEPLREMSALLGAGADPNVRDDMNDTPLIFCSIYGYQRCVRLLIKQGADVNAVGGNSGTALMSTTDVSICRLLLEHGAKVNQRFDNGNTALSMAADGFETEGKTEVLCLLIQARADVNAANDDGETPLMSAALFGNSTKIRILLQADADPTMRNKEGRTAFAIVHHQIAIGHPAYKEYKRALKVFQKWGIRE